MSYLYGLKTKLKLKEVTSNITTIFDVKELIEPVDYNLFLEIFSLTYYISTKNHSDSYDNIYF